VKILYLGSDPSRFASEGDVTHLQLIEIVPRPIEEIEWVLADWEEYTHLLFTSKHAVSLFFSLLKSRGFAPKHSVIAVGQTTAKIAVQYGWKEPLCASSECQEGVLDLLRKMDWKSSDYILMPRSSLARGALENYCIEQNLRHQVCDLYDTIPKKVLLPDLEQFDQIFFSSPSTVKAFFSLIQKLPKRPELKAIGSVTQQNLAKAVNTISSSLGYISEMV